MNSTIFESLSPALLSTLSNNLAKVRWRSVKAWNKRRKSLRGIRVNIGWNFLFLGRKFLQVTSRHKAQRRFRDFSVDGVAINETIRTRVQTKGTTLVRFEYLFTSRFEVLYIKITGKKHKPRVILADTKRARPYARESRALFRKSVHRAIEEPDNRDSCNQYTFHFLDPVKCHFFPPLCPSTLST